MYKLIRKNNKARRGELLTRKGKIQTPAFMPIATKGAIKTISAEEIRRLNPDVILGNTYHLMLRPGAAEIKALGGLHRFMDWNRPILTDSGGFQVFSLAKIRKIMADGVRFGSHLDGKQFFMTPEDSLRIQMNIGSDIMMVLDECVKLPAEPNYLAQSVELTLIWAERCKKFFLSQYPDPAALDRPRLFGIVQGGLDPALRARCASGLAKIGFDGYAIGGLAVGETEQEMYSALDFIPPLLSEDKPRYLMGVGYPHQIVEAVKRGVDMFDCVIPAREARHGRLYSWNQAFIESGKNILELLENSKEFFSAINIRNEEYKFDLRPINPSSKFSELQKYSRAYLRHLFNMEDPLAQRLATLNNLEFYLSLMAEIRASI